jgi:two-component system response regulator YesN
MCKRFKDETGITIGNYIRMQRLYLAKKLLAETKLPISTIAMDCGFSDLAHFTKLFHTVVKMPPSAYRKQHSASSTPF